MLAVTCVPAAADRSMQAWEEEEETCRRRMAPEEKRGTWHLVASLALKDAICGLPCLAASNYLWTAAISMAMLCVMAKSSAEK